MNELKLHTSNIYGNSLHITEYGDIVPDPTPIGPDSDPFVYDEIDGLIRLKENTDINLNIGDKWYLKEWNRRIINQKATSIGRSAFEYQGELSPITVDMPNVLSVGWDSFIECNALVEAKFQNATEIQSNAFQRCLNLVILYAPNVEYAYNSILLGAKSIQQISFPKAVLVGRYAFRYCSNLTSVYLPMVETVDEGAFSDCPLLSTITLESAVHIGPSAFKWDVGLNHVILPNATDIKENAFQYCKNLQTIQLPSMTVEEVKSQYQSWQICTVCNILCKDGEVTTVPVEIVDENITEQSEV